MKFLLAWFPVGKKSLTEVGPRCYAIRPKLSQGGGRGPRQANGLAACVLASGADAHERPKLPTVALRIPAGFPPFPGRSWRCGSARTNSAGLPGR